jgi:asparagine synthase (glutamine-hydrolysing)
MSGIAGIHDSSKVDNLPQILEKISHRGSKPPEVWQSPNSAFGALGIHSVDVSNMTAVTASGNRAIVWDGWIENNESLRQTLALHAISGTGLADTVLHLYEEYGTNSFELLDGEFALAIVEENRLILARDRLGIKPLYYGIDDGTIYFASEAKALVDFVKRIREFPPGCFFISDQGLYPYQPYLPEPIVINGAQDSAERLGSLLKDVVVSHLPTHADVGVWLSGGVDSSIVAALANYHVDSLFTFSAGIAGAPDLKYAHQVAQHLKTNHYERNYDLEDALKILEQVIYHLESFDAPLIRSSIGNFLVAELASNHVPFVLSGEGGDELFAGYAYQKEFSSEVELTLSVQEAIAALHNTALQRVDRSASAYKTHAGLPFLDPRIVRYALAIPSRWKIRGSQEIEKWTLRQAMATDLPDEVVWRGKAKFWEGAGAAELMVDYAERQISDTDFEKECEIGYGMPLRSKEELLYYRIFRSLFGDKIPIDEIGRTRPI